MKISREKGIGYERIRRCLWRLQEYCEFYWFDNGQFIFSVEY